jgi:Fuc2NAc and GlcNAc transferase
MIFGVLAASFVGSSFYPRIAMRYGIHAVPNPRSLHQKITPRGAGIVIALVDLAAVLLSYLLGWITFQYLMVFCVGPAVVSLVGIADDRYDLRPRWRLPLQIAAGSWMLFWLGGLPPLGLGSWTVDLGWPGIVLALAALVWFFNFVDGIDGMLASGTIYSAGAATVILFLKGDVALAGLAGLLAAGTGGPLRSNWPPARVFLGDSGSSFISYFVAALILASLWKDAMSLWTWLVLLGYFVVDTTVTMAIRVVRVPKWYRAHRSHAYQNLARIWNDHRKGVLLVLLIDLLWLLPLAAASVWKPKFALLVALAAFLPIGVFVARNGPLRENC